MPESGALDRCGGGGEGDERKRSNNIENLIYRCIEKYYMSKIL